MKIPKIGILLTAVGLLLTIIVGEPATASVQKISGSTVSYFGVGARDIAPTAGGRSIYVSMNGTNVVPVTQPWGYVEYNRVTCLDKGPRPKNEEQCPEPDIEHPLRTIQSAVRIAKPGDVIVVRSGTYDERVGWSARPGKATARIHLQAFPGERVQLNGYLSLRGADYWTVNGIRFSYSAQNTTGESIVNFFGGTGWSFIHNEVTGTRGVANLLVRDETPDSNSTVDRAAAAPHNYLIGGNCIRGASKTGRNGEMHNIYLMPTIYSTGGAVTRNVIAGAPMGANIKASGSTDPFGSPRNLSITRNTILYGSSGISIGQLAQSVATERNLIARSSNSGPYSGGVKTYDLAAFRENSVKDTLISGYSSAIYEEWGKTGRLFEARNVTPKSVDLTGSVDNCTVRAVSPSTKANYGHESTN